MGRPRRKHLFTQERIYLATLIGAALSGGQRGDGTPPPWKPWTEIEFAKKVCSNEYSAKEWRDRVKPTRPVNIEQILDAFYGSRPEYAEARQTMRQAWRRAGGIDSDDPPDSRKIKTFNEVAEVVHLLANQPTPDNQGNLIVPYTLRIRCDQNREIPIKANGRPVTVTIDIGLTKPILKIRSDYWQPLQDTIFRKKKHRRTTPGPTWDSVTLTGDTDGNGCIVNEPLEDEPNVTMEKRGGGDDGPITLSVVVPRDGIHVTLSDGTAISATQKDVIDAIFAEAIPRDRENTNRLEVAKVEVTPGAANPLA